MDVTRKLKVMGSALTKNIDENISTIQAAFRRLRKSMKDSYPNEKFLDVEFIEIPDPESAAA